MIHNGRINAIIDWEFAGSYPLSEVLGGDGIELFEPEDDNMREAREWSDRIRDGAVEKAKARGWSEDNIDLLVGPGNLDLQLARREIFPEPDPNDGGESGIGEDESEKEDGKVCAKSSGFDEDVARISMNEEAVEP